MNNFDQFKKDFKRDVLIEVIIDLKYDKTSQARAKNIAAAVLNIFEEESEKEVFGQINKLAETHPNILDIFIKRAHEYEDRDREERLNQIHLFLKPNGGGEN